MCSNLNKFFSCTRAAPGDERDEFEPNRRQQRRRCSRSRGRHTRTPSSVSSESVGAIIYDWEGRITYRAMERADQILDECERERDRERDREREREREKGRAREWERERERVRDRNCDQKH